MSNWEEYHSAVRLLRLANIGLVLNVVALLIAVASLFIDEFILPALIGLLLINLGYKGWYNQQKAKHEKKYPS